MQLTSECFKALKSQAFWESTDTPSLHKYLKFRLHEGNLEAEETEHLRYNSDLNIISKYYSESSEIGQKVLKWKQDFKNDKSSNQINHFWDLQVKRHNVEMEIKLLEAKNKLLMKEQDEMETQICLEQTHHILDVTRDTREQGLLLRKTITNKFERRVFDDSLELGQKRKKKNLSLSKNKEPKKAKTTGRKENVDDNIDDLFISNNRAINLAESSDFSKDNYSSSSSSIKPARGSFISASFDNKSQDISPGSEGWETESIDVVRGEEEIGELNQDEIGIRNKLLTILLAQQEKDIKPGKDILSSTSLNNIIDLSNNEVQTEVNKSLNKNQIEWIDRVLRKKVWNKTFEFQQYISQFTEDVCDRIHIPVLVRESFVPKGSFNSYNHESHDIAQQIMTHFSVRLEAPRRVESESLDYERTYSIDTIIYIINRLFRMHQDVVDLVWIELTTPDTKKHKIDGLTKIISTTQKNQTIILIEFSFARRAPKSKKDNDQIKLYRNSMRTLNKLLQSIPKDIARVYLIQSVNGLIEIKYLVRPLPSIYILQLFTCVKIPVSFDDFEQFAKNIVDLMEWQVDVLSTVRKMNKVTTGNTHNHITSIQDTPEKKKDVEKNPTSPKSPCPGGSIPESLSLI